MPVQHSSTECQSEGQLNVDITSFGQEIELAPRTSGELHPEILKCRGSLLYPDPESGFGIQLRRKISFQHEVVFGRFPRLPGD